MIYVKRRSSEDDRRNHSNTIVLNPLGNWQSVYCMICWDFFFLHTRVSANIRMYVHTHIHTYIYIYIHIHMYRYLHLHMDKNMIRIVTMMTNIMTYENKKIGLK